MDYRETIDEMWKQIESDQKLMKKLTGSEYDLIRSTFYRLAHNMYRQGWLKAKGNKTVDNYNETV